MDGMDLGAAIVCVDSAAFASMHLSHRTASKYGTAFKGSTYMTPHAGQPVSVRPVTISSSQPAY